MRDERKWPETITEFEVEPGTTIPVRVRHRLLNANDPDVSFAYINCSSMGSEASVKAAFARGYEKARFEANEWSLPLTTGLLYEVVKAMLPILRKGQKLWIEPYGNWHGAPVDKCFLINGVGEITFAHTVATFQAEAEKGRAQITGHAVRTGDQEVFIEEVVPEVLIRRGAAGLKTWTRLAGQRLRKAARLQAQIGKMGVRLASDYND